MSAPEIHDRSVAALIARYLKSQGVQRVYGLCGGHIMPLWMRLDAEGIRIIDVRELFVGILSCRLADVGADVAYKDLEPSSSKVSRRSGDQRGTTLLGGDVSHYAGDLPAALAPGSHAGFHVVARAQENRRA